jgi:putative chitobiose transport system substrate-binding protein
MREIKLLALALSILSCCCSCERDDGASADARVRIELWTISLRPKFDAYLPELVARYERENPGVDVVWVDVPFDAMQRKFLASAAAGRSPDVVNLSDGFYSRFAALGGLTDLTPLVPGDPDETYVAGALALCRMDGKLYALPWYVASSVMYVNEKLLAEGGLTPQTLATDWPGLREQAVEFRRRTGKFLFCAMLGQETRLPMWISQNGLKLFRSGPEGAVVSNLDDPRVIEFVRAWVDFYRSGALPSEAAVGGHGPMIDLYKQGRTAMLITGPNFLVRIRDEAPDVYAQTRVLPAIRFESGKFEIATMLISVPSTSKHPKEAADFAWFLTNAQNQLTFAKLGSVLPSTIASLDDPYFAAPTPQELATPAGRIAEARHLSRVCLDNARSFIPPLPAWPDLTKSFQEGIQSALLDGEDVEETMRKISREWDGILRSHGTVKIESVE